MNFFSSSSFNLLLLLLLILILLPHNVNSTLFSFSSFQPNLNTILYQGDAFVASGVILVTKSQRNVVQIRLVEWVWELYGKGKVLEASDKGLRAEFDEQEMECLMVVGLWCCRPDHKFRPSIRQVIDALNFEAPLPRLPSTLPVPMYFAPPMEMCRFSYTSSVGVTDSVSDQNRTQTTSSSFGSSMSAGSSEALLQLRGGPV